MTAQQSNQIRRMFARIARVYDLNNHLHSLGRDRTWRRKAAIAAKVKADDRVLDVACGTGDLTGMLAAAWPARIVGLDFCHEMLRLAKAKFSASGIEWIEADALAMPFDAGRFDVVAIAFGLRNIPDATAALGEFSRVLAPGGRLVVLDFCGGGPAGLCGKFLSFYIRHIMSRTASWIAGTRGEYRYLHDSMRGFLTPDQLTTAIECAGFEGVNCQLLASGLAAIHVGIRP